MNDTNAVVDLIADAITDSFGPDWDALEAALHVMQWLENEGLQIVAKAAAERGDGWLPPPPAALKQEGQSDD